MSDLAGLDIGWKAETSTGSSVRDILCESGRRGQKNGRGYYTYDDDRNATPDPEVEQLIRDFAQKQGIEQREVSDQEILERCLYPMVNEGAKILTEGIAIRPSDIDVVWVNGYGWPVYTGGPMFWADTIGLAEVAARIEHYSQAVGGSQWELSPLLRRLADQGAGFGSLKAGELTSAG
jgi:3-hydroxyacyl-CoA dehydrogenase